MDSTYRPQSPDLGSYAPQSPNLNDLRPQSPNLQDLQGPGFGGGSPWEARIYRQHVAGAFAGTGVGAFGGQALSYSPTSVPQLQQQASWDCNYQQTQPNMAAMRGIKSEDADDEYMPDAPPASKRPRKAGKAAASNGASQSTSDPSMGVNLKTSFPVARIKRIMQADEDIGKVAQVTPHVVSRALELFMIRLISASAAQARGGASTLPPSEASTSRSNSTAGGAGKAPKKVLAQHMKKAMQADPNFDFLMEIAEKVPDAPTKAAKKEVTSESDEEEKKPAKGRKKAGAGGGAKKRKDSGDDF